MGNSIKTLGHYDIAIVGGGIAGLYCCLRMPQGKRVALFEATDRLGGKVETVMMSGFKAEYGAMRFDPSRQPLIGQLLSELELETEPFPEYSSPPVDGRKMIWGLEGKEKNLNALELFAYGIGKILGKSEIELLTTSEEELEVIRRNGLYRGRPLYEHGLWQMLSDVMSPDAVNYIITEGSFFHGIHENPGAAGTMITWVKMLQMSKNLKGVKGGMQGITDGMADKVMKKGVPIYMGHSLITLAPEFKGNIALQFDAGKVSAAQVILAIPAPTLKRIGGMPGDITELFDSVIEYPLLKCFFMVKDPWWDEDIPNRGSQAIPTRELHYKRQGETGMVMIYSDRPSINFWSRYVTLKPHYKAEICTNGDLPQIFADRMHISADRVLNYGLRDWTREPYGAGVQLWKVGVQPWRVSSILEAFSLSAGAPKNIHICGEAFSDYQGFMEGALRSAQSALDKALN